jgi:hypothetical protein
MNALRDAFRQPSSRIRLWGDFAIFSMLVMESFWITDWYSALAHPRASWVIVDLFMCAALVLTHLLARGMGYFNLHSLGRRAILIVWVIVWVVVGFPLVVYNGAGLSIQQMVARVVNSFINIETDLIEFWHILLLLLIVLHGISLAREALPVYIVQANFQLGLFMLLLYGLLFSWDRPDQALITTYGFLFTAIAAMSAARISTLSEMRGGRLPPLHAPWLLGILAIASLVVGLAVIVGWFSTGIAANALAILTAIVFGILLLVGMVVFSPIILIILSLGPALRGLLETLSKITILADLLKFASNAAEKLGINPAWLASAARTTRPLLLLGVLGSIILLIMVALVWKPWKRRLIEEETTLALPLRAALHFPRLFLRRLSGRMSNQGRLLAAARIRWVYAQLMSLCTRLGKPRPESTTPLEFLPAAQSLFPREEHTLATITHSYLNVRYGELPETYEEVQAVLLGWERINTQGRQYLKSQKRKRLLPAHNN